jgi:thiol-disulfide isomerase/thioredoxin
MKNSKSLIGSLLIALVVAAGLWVYFGYAPSLSPAQAKIELAGKGIEQLPEFEFRDLEGNLRNSSEWKGKVLVVNFWATWCPPCREEMPLFVDTQEQYSSNGLQFVGIAIDDPMMVRDFVDVYGINFPVLVGGPEAIKLANSMGNRFDSLPFTAIFDRDGTTRYVTAGQVAPEVLEKELKPLL